MKQIPWSESWGEAQATNMAESKMWSFCLKNITFKWKYISAGDNWKPAGERVNGPKYSSMQATWKAQCYTTDEKTEQKPTYQS